MRFALLGPVRVWSDDHQIEIRGTMRRSLLAALLLRANTVISDDRLIEILWGQKPPAAPMAPLYNQVMRLRRALGAEGERIEAVAPGYLIRVRPDELDLTEFEAHCAAGRREMGQGHWDRAAQEYAAALALWRGTPLADVPGLATDPELHRLDELRLQAQQGRIEADLNLSRHDEVIDELCALTEADPVHEAFHGQLMLALYRSGRQTEALDVYVALREAMVEGLGLEPKASVQALRSRILRDDPTLTIPAMPPTPGPSEAPATPGSPAARGSSGIPATSGLSSAPESSGAPATPGSSPVHLPSGAPATPGSSPVHLPSGAPSASGSSTAHTLSGAPSASGSSSAVGSSGAPPASGGSAALGASKSVGVRRQLPVDTRAFTGRAEELDALLALARAVPGDTGTGAAVVCAIDGMAGIGKTALAVHVAHRVSDGFPDGQLFLDLRGYSTGQQPRTTEDALGYLLRSLDVPPQRIPRDLAERAAFYRSQLSGTKTLIVLDNAASASQIRPLLPDTPGCLALVTSRKTLSGLDEAHPLALRTLPKPDAVDLLHKTAGPGRIAQGDPDLDELLDKCGYVPLAIRIAAARLRHQRTLSVAGLVTQLRDEGSRLDYLRDEDRDLIAMFESSYAGLTEPEQHMFRHLGLVPGPDVDAYAAANLVGASRGDAEALLESLLDHNLLMQHTPGRYRLHDLLRAYARTLTDKEASAPGRDGEAIRVRAYARTLTDKQGSAPGREGEAIREGALEGLLDYYQHTAYAADAFVSLHRRSGSRAVVPSPVVAPQLSSPSDALAWMRAESDNLSAAVAHASGAGRPSRALALSSPLADFLHREGLWPQAAALQEAAVGVAAELGDRGGEAAALHGLGRLRASTGEFAAGAEALERSLAISEDIADRQGEANALRVLCRLRLMTGDVPAAIAFMERAVRICAEIGDRQGEANALADLGHARYMTGQFSAAAEMMSRGLAICQELGDRRAEASVLQDLGRVWLVAGDFPAAVTVTEQALAVFRELGEPLSEADALNQLSNARRATGDFPAATELAERSLALCRELGNRRGVASTLRSLGRTRFATGDFTAAAELAEQSLALCQEIGDRSGEANTLHDLGRARHATATAPAAPDPLQPPAPVQAADASVASDLLQAPAPVQAAHVSAGLDLLQAPAPVQAADASATADSLQLTDSLQAVDLLRAADVSVAVDSLQSTDSLQAVDLLQAADLLQQAREAFRALGDPQGEVEVLNSMAALLADTAGSKEALDTYKDALDLARNSTSPLDEAHALEGIARCLDQLGNRSAALTELRLATDIYRRIGSAEAARASAYLAALEGA